LSNSIGILDKLTQKYPLVARYRHNLARNYHEVGRLGLLAKDLDEAQAALEKALEIQTRLVREDASAYHHVTSLAFTQDFLGQLMEDKKAPARALEWYTKAIQTVKAVYEQNKKNDAACQALDVACSGRAKLLMKQGLYAQAVQDYDLAIEVHRGFFGPNLQGQRTLARAYQGDHGRATLEAAEWTKAKDTAAGALMLGARVYALSARAAGCDVNLAVAGQKNLATAYAVQAMDLLARASSAGYFNQRANLARLKSPDFDAVSMRDDFKKLYPIVFCKQLLAQYVRLVFLCDNLRLPGTAELHTGAEHHNVPGCRIAYRNNILDSPHDIRQLVFTEVSDSFHALLRWSLFELCHVLS
jgi:tetratricopeptide (TPR) repeat protein